MHKLIARCRFADFGFELLDCQEWVAAVQHAMAIGTDDSQIFQTGLNLAVGIGEWTEVMDFAKLRACFAIELPKVEAANGAGQPSGGGKHFATLGGDNPAVALAVKVLPRGHRTLARRNFPGLDVGQGSGGNCSGCG
jgi:hypothetical protein